MGKYTINWLCQQKYFLSWTRHGLACLNTKIFEFSVDNSGIPVAYDQPNERIDFLIKGKQSKHKEFS